MAAVPQAAFAARKIRTNEEKRKQFECNTDFPLTNYSSKFMDSIWGQYNRYSVHNLKKIMDNNIFEDFGLQTEKSFISQNADKPLISANVGSNRSLYLPLPFGCNQLF